MTPGSFRFERFTFNPADRQLRRDGAPVELSSRYLDALALMVREHGRLVSKDRFMEEVWRGVPVTDEALTQCIRALRRQLGDDAGRPRFIETVPKHGYRFIAPVEVADLSQPALQVQALAAPWRRFVLLGLAGTLGGGVAGMLGGLFYGFVSASDPGEGSLGAVSVLLVLLFLTIVTALTGAAGVGFGIAAAAFAPRRAWLWSILGGAVGGMLVGGFVKLLGLDAFNLLFGRSPGDITGAPEGALLGGAVGLGAVLAGGGASARPLAERIAAAGATGAAVAVLIPVVGGRLMGGSLDLLARGFPGSNLRLDPIGEMVGERGFGPLSQMLTAGLEGFLFGACIVGAMLLARRRLGEIR